MNTRLRQRDNIHIAFDRDNRLGWLSTLRLAGFTCTKTVVNHPAFMKELCFRRVQVFRRRVGGKRTPTESDDASTQILDREHDTVAETIIGNSNPRRERQDHKLRSVLSKYLCSPETP